MVKLKLNHSCDDNYTTVVTAVHVPTVHWCIVEAA